MYGITSTNSTAPPTTSTVTLPPTTITVTPTAAATPTIACAFWDKDFVADEFELYNIGGGWVTDGGAKLKKEEKGCGALTFWKWVDATDTTYTYILLSADCLRS